MHLRQFRDDDLEHPIAGLGADVLRIRGLGQREAALEIAAQALDAAQAGLPAMLVDASLGEESLTRIYAPEAQFGLHDIVTGKVGLVRAALQDEGTGLFFLPRVGRTDLVGVEQIGSGFLEKARRFGPIIIDGGAVGTDGLALRFAEVADDIVLVLREGAVGEGDLASATAALGEQANKLRGFVVNEA